MAELHAPVQEIFGSLRCPVCGSTLKSASGSLTCAGAILHTFPVVNNVPVLIHDRESVFSIEDFTSGKNPFYVRSRETLLKRIAGALMPSNSLNVGVRERYARFVKEVRRASRTPKILIVGGSIEGEGIDALLGQRNMTIVETDVAWGPRVQVICDIHNLPFADSSFDGVVVQAVLEHVVDPFRGVSEIHRVLAENGVVYAETPFMQQVHGGRFDFTRFSYLGHRRLFRFFSEITSGAACGPGMALAWAWQYFLWSFSSRPMTRRILLFIARWTSFFWKYADYALVCRPRALDAASGYYFMGRRSHEAISDRELIALYDRIEHP